MNRDNLSSIMEQYVRRFEEINDPKGPNDEGYKWRVESAFVQHWDIDADDFAEMFKNAMSEISKTNLINNGTVQPIGGIFELLKHSEEVEFVRERFRELFSDDDGDLKKRQERIEHFAQEINSHIDRYAPGSWKYPQAINNVIYYLNLWRPGENYIFKSTEATDWANCIEFGDDFGSGAAFSLEKYYRMCDELLAELPKYDEVMKLHHKRFEREARGFDDKLHIMVYDIMYCAHWYGFYTGVRISKMPIKKRIEAAKLREKREALQQQILDKESQLEILKKSSISLPNLIGSTVKHKSFGAGTVLTCEAGRLVVSFRIGEKTFIYPDALTGGFLTCEDEAVLCQIQTAKEYKESIYEAEKEVYQLKAAFAKL